MSPFEHGEVFVLDDGGEVGGCGCCCAQNHDDANACINWCKARPYTYLCNAQVDLDLGNYERFLDITLTKDNNLTTGKVYQVAARLHAVQLYVMMMPYRHAVSQKASSAAQMV